MYSFVRHSIITYFIPPLAAVIPRIETPPSPKLLDGEGTRDEPHATQDAPKPSRGPPRRRRPPAPGRRQRPRRGGPPSPTQGDARARACGLATPPGGDAPGQRQPPRLLLGGGLRQGRGRGEPQVLGGAGGDRGGHGEQGDGLLRRGGIGRARRRQRGARRLRRAPGAPPARRRRRAPPLHGAQDGAAQGRAQAARGLGCREVWIWGGNLGGNTCSFEIEIPRCFDW
ncbi:hypothetical protein PAHAL_3G141200 [Panicum hallii]|uniref:Uncharacterized protein n=1 Tax=Panicum hallii TaxID=206008 RepID=A0A2S3H8M6_9POAL|nr:hypothetical protein PAHAL_3G141200 [Panicum hallii]